MSSTPKHSPLRIPPPSANAQYAISRLCSRGGFWYWLVAFRRRAKHYYKSFYDVRRGGAEQALAAAIAWRDEQLAQARAFGKREFCQLRRTNNTSGIPGVQFIRPHNQPDGSWQARHKLPDGRERTKTFAVQKYGEREAFRLAVEARREMLEAVENTPFLHHPVAKEFCERQAAKSAGGET